MTRPALETHSNVKRPALSRTDLLALLLSLLAVGAAYWVTGHIFEHLPHIEDEWAYSWQARAIATGRLTIASPPFAQNFLVPFVVDYHGQRFGKYPLGWPALLSVGILLGLRSWVNPLLAGLGTWLTYRLGQRTLGPTVGLLAAGLTVTSPFFLMNSGSLLTHPLGLVLSAAFALAWLEAFASPEGSAHPRLATVTAAASLGLLALTRPLTAVGVALPFGLHGVYLLVRGDWPVRRRLLVFGALALAISSLYIAWQFAVSGDPWLNPYTLWWPYDKVGFGPGYGRLPQGHNLEQAWFNTQVSLLVGAHDLFGWGAWSWIFLPFGLWAIRRQPRALLLASVFPVLVIVYLAYWVGSYLFGPRYFYEGLFSLTLTSAAGIACLAGWPSRLGEHWQPYTGRKRLRPLLAAAVLALLVWVNLWFYLPARLASMKGLYGITRLPLATFQTPEARAFAPALIIVHADRWMQYAPLMELESPTLDSPFIFALSGGRLDDAQLAAAFPQRTVLHYYTDEPGILYSFPK
jgi:hypothetical protein